ncbi:YqhR family membrane protein [Virgibacillus litoralis]|uniref:Membrane protein YagU involved in acid resistance n=1 Tax=Virgibacillus litoralis TaxID=578221 RepID=A0ABS4HHH8_9BACI|nr:YqhR family membrane protein [Virgibacillus litoralis]MBP1950376.1 putative membrane protein YagU involved in acid resistance [Virgibacillus litoralis]
MKEDKNLEQNKREQPMSLLSRSLTTGFVGGLIASSIGVIMYYFSFSEVAPKSYLIRSWITADWTDGWLGNTLSILMIGVLSLLTAFIYYGIFKKIGSLWMGVGYGIILWVIVFYIVQPIFPNIPNLMDLNRYTIVSTLCLFILYGTFIGYSISYDYADTIRKEDELKEKQN